MLKKEIMHMSDPSKQNYRNRILQAVFIIGMAILFTVCSYAQSVPRIADPKPEISYQVLVRNLQDSLKTETQSLDEIKTRSEKINTENERLSSVISSYRIQLSSHNSLLFLPNTVLEDLENAASTQEQSINFIDDLISETEKNLSEIDNLQAQSSTQLELYKKNEMDITASYLKEKDLKDATNYLKQLVDVNNQKKRILSETSDILSKKVEALDQIKKEFIQQSNTFAEIIRKKRTKERFERKASPIDFDVWNTFSSEVQSIQSQLHQIVKREFWLSLLSLLRGSAGALFLAALILYIFLITSLYRLRSFCITLPKRDFFLKFPWRNTAFQLICCSMLLMGTILFLFTYATLRNLFDSVPFVYPTILVLLVFLITNWALNLIRLWPESPLLNLSGNLVHRLCNFVIALRYLAISYVVMDWMLLNDAILLLLLRLSIELFIFVRVALFAKEWERKNKEENPTQKTKRISLERFFISIAYIIGVIPMVMDFLGYGSLATYWLAGLGRSFPVLMWAMIFFNLLREWDQKFYSRDQAASAKPAQPIKWIVFRVSWLTWGVSVLLLLMLVWGGQQAIFDELGRILRYNVDIGNFKISLLGLIHVVSVLFLTHIVVRLWRYILQEQFLKESGIETGMKESIVAINVYILWSIGIVVSLSAFGVSGTSLTVAFGALSIGLGFGLQNIFNNFISGIIMLFERPIQVGDSVEINGIWGEIKKINFRSTIVQTFDNASLIIPNSDFISNQVTNWSFNNQSLRIKIIVGVDYGTDTELVRDLLMDIAKKTPDVRKLPIPDVLFQDFGDSALVFTLRVWTSIDGMLKTASAIRFEIDKIFKENQIGIPFPQRDLHIRSISDSIKIEPETPKESLL